MTRLKDYKHLIKVVGTYTDKRYFALILDLVAHGTLKDYLLAGEPQSDEAMESLFSYFGSMAKVMLVLHEELNMLHKDIKLDNYLIKNVKLILTDFGTAFDWPHTDHSMTMANEGDARTERYASPEVIKSGEFYRASDKWSLGIVYLEMTTALHKRSLWEIESHLCSHWTKTMRIYENRDAALDWFSVLRSQNQLAVENEPLSWVLVMLEPVHSQRITATDLFETIASFQNGRFCGECFLEQESDFSSEFSLLASDNDEQAERPRLLPSINASNGLGILPALPGQ